MFFILFYLFYFCFITFIIITVIFIFLIFILFLSFLFYFILFYFIILLYFTFSYHFYFVYFYFIHVYSILFYSILFILLFLGGSGDMPNSVNYKTFSSSEEFKKILEVQNIETFSPYLSIFILSFRLKLVDPIFPYYLPLLSLFICTLLIASLFIFFFSTLLIPSLLILIHFSSFLISSHYLFSCHIIPSLFIESPLIFILLFYYRRMNLLLSS